MHVMAAIFLCACSGGTTKSDVDIAKSDDTIIVLSSRLVWRSGREGEDGQATASGLRRGGRRGRRLSGGCHLHLSESFCICPHLSASWPALRGGDRLTKRHKVKKVKKTRIQEVPEFRGPGAASRFGRGFARPSFGRVSAWSL